MPDYWTIYRVLTSPILLRGSSEIQLPVRASIGIHILNQDAETSLTYQFESYLLLIENEGGSKEKKKHNIRLRLLNSFPSFF